MRINCDNRLKFTGYCVDAFLIGSYWYLIKNIRPSLNLLELVALVCRSKRNYICIKWPADTVNFDTNSKEDNQRAKT